VGRPARWLALLATTLALAAAACDETTSPAQPSPEAVDTAEAVASTVRFGAPFSTTPSPGDEERDTPVELDGRVFGDGNVGVILAHMRPVDQTSWFSFATQLAASGDYTVLTFNFRGYEASGGEKEFDRVDTDLAAAYRFMREELNIERVILVGARMGGTAALLVAQREPVAAVVSISSPATYQQLDTLEDIDRVTAPKLFISSEDDLNAARSQEQFWALAVEPKEQELYPGSAHGTDLFASPAGDAFEQRLLQFIQEHRTPDTD